MAILNTHKLTKIYPNKVTAVDRIDLSVNKGEIYGFIGPNGAGKTTTIKILNTLLAQISGSAEIDGLDITKKAADVRRIIGYVSQDIGVDENATGIENLMLYGRYYRLDRATINRRVAELIALVDLNGTEKRMVKTYSGGMRRRLDLAMGLIHHPKLIFLDEPTTGLDPQARRSVWDYIKKLVEHMGVTIFLTTHYLEEADHLCDRVTIIDNGKIVVTGTPDSLKHSIGGDVVTVSPRLSSDISHEIYHQEITTALSGQSFVLGIQSSGADVAVYVKEVETSAPEIMRVLTEKGIETGKLSITHPSLDDVFLKYTGRAIQDNQNQ